MNGLMMKLDIPSNRDDPITVHYNDYSDGGKVGVPKSMEVDLVIGADGANSRVAKDIDAGECDYAIAFQVGLRGGCHAMQRHYACLFSRIVISTVFRPVKKNSPAHSKQPPFISISC